MKVLAKPSRISSIDACFQEEMGSLPEDYWPDWMAELKKDNDRRLAEVDEGSWLFLTEKSVQYIFTLCARLRLPHEVRYSAAMILDKFMRVHTRQMFHFLRLTNMRGREKREEWEKVETSMSRQLTLRLCTAIQISSKEHNYHNSLSMKQIANCLRSLGTPYTKRAVLKSELRVLKTLEFSLPESPLVYAESLLSILQKSMAVKIDYDAMWNYVLILLDIVFIKGDKVYLHLLQSVIGERGKRCSRNDMARLRSDWMLLGTALVAAAALCHYGSVHADKIADVLEEECGTPAVDTIDLMISIIAMASGEESVDSLHSVPSARSSFHQDLSQNPNPFCNGNSARLFSV